MTVLNSSIHADGYDQKILKESISSILESVKLCSMATSNGAEPYINTAYFAYGSDLRIYFLSQPTLQHSLNLAKNSSVSLTIFDSSQPFASHLLGLQIFGKSVLTSDQSARCAFDLYTLRFPKLLDRVASFEDYQRGVIKSRFYEITTNSIKIFDEARFGKDVWITAIVDNKTKVLEGFVSEA